MAFLPDWDRKVIPPAPNTFTRLVVRFLQLQVQLFSIQPLTLPTSLLVAERFISMALKLQPVTAQD